LNQEFFLFRVTWISHYLFSVVVLTHSHSLSSKIYSDSPRPFLLSQNLTLFFSLPSSAFAATCWWKFWIFSMVTLCCFCGVFSTCFWRLYSRVSSFEHSSAFLLSTLTPIFLHFDPLQKGFFFPIVLLKVFSCPKFS